jgi:hypothetical protein
MPPITITIPSCHQLGDKAINKWTEKGGYPIDSLETVGPQFAFTQQSTGAVQNLKPRLIGLTSQSPHPQKP